MDLAHSLHQFGLDRQETQVYLTLAKHPWITALKLSRLIEIKRPTLYRILERLQDKGLVEVKLEEKTSYFNIASPDSFANIITQQETKISQLKNNLAEMTTILSLTSQSAPTETIVHFYRGKKSLAYLENKKANCVNENLFIFDAGDLWFNIHGRDFAEKMRQKYVDNNIKIYELQNSPAITAVKDINKVDWTSNIAYLSDHYYHRRISKRLLDLSQDIYIIKDGIYMHNYNQDDIVGIEIVSKNYSQLLKQLFILAWNQAKIIDKFGGRNF